MARGPGGRPPAGERMTGAGLWCRQPGRVPSGVQERPFPADSNALVFPRYRGPPLPLTPGTLPASLLPLLVREGPEGCGREKGRIPRIATPAASRPPAGTSPPAPSRPWRLPSPRSGAGPSPPSPLAPRGGLVSLAARPAAGFQREPSVFRRVIVNGFDWPLIPGSGLSSLIPRSPNTAPPPPPRALPPFLSSLSRPATPVFLLHHSSAAPLTASGAPRLPGLRLAETPRTTSPSPLLHHSGALG